MKKMMSIIMLLMMNFSLKAQDAKPVDLDGSLNFSAGVDSRTVTGSANSSEVFYLFNPSLLAVTQYSPRTRLLANYTPEFQMFTEHREFNTWNHSAHLSASRNFSPRFSLNMGDSFFSTTDPSRQLANSFLLLPRSRYWENALYVRGDFSLSPKTMLSFGFDNTVTRYGLAAEFRKNFRDQMGSAGTTTLSRQWREGKKITATYTLLHLTLLDSPGLPANAVSDMSGPTHYVTVGYLDSSRPELTVGITAGFVRAADFSYALSAQIRKRVGTIWLDAGYSRTLSIFGGQAFNNPGSAQLGAGLLASNWYEMVTLGVSGNLGRRFGLSSRVTGSRTNSGPGALTSRGLIGAVSLDYRITGHMAFYSVAEFYHQNLNRFPGFPSSRHRFYGGIKFSFRERLAALGGGSQALPPSLPTQASGN